MINHFRNAQGVTKVIGYLKISQNVTYIKKRFQIVKPFTKIDLKDALCVEISTSRFSTKIGIFVRN